MRRSNREITDRNEILQVMERCDVCRLALNDGEYPYILPLNFGMEQAGEQIILYFHGATEGKKLDLIAKDPRERLLHYGLSERHWPRPSGAGPGRRKGPRPGPSDGPLPRRSGPIQPSGHSQDHRAPAAGGGNFRKNKRHPETSRQFVNKL